MTKMVDPPSGWHYGFPKPIPDNIYSGDEEDYIQWFRDQGYPDRLIAQSMLNHCRFWEKDE